MRKMSQQTDACLNSATRRSARCWMSERPWPLTGERGRASRGVLLWRCILGQLPFVVSPWNVGAALEYSAALARGATATLRADDIFRSRNPGPFAANDPNSVSDWPGVPPDPSTNLLNLRATVQWASYATSLFVNNALDAHPVLLRNTTSFDFALSVAQTFRPRTLGLAASWRY